MEEQSARNSAADFNALAGREGWPTLCDHTVRFTRAELVSLLALWRQKAQACGLPTRADMTPRVLKPFLRDIAIYERVPHASGGHRYRVRVVGDTFAHVMGDLIGKFIDDAVPAKFLPRWIASLDATLAAAAPLRFLSRSDTNDMSFLVAEYFSAPLAGPDGTPSLVLGVAHYDGARSWETVCAEACARLQLDETSLAPVIPRPGPARSDGLNA